MLEFIKQLFGFGDEQVHLSGAQKSEADSLIKELIQIGISQDYLSERPGGAFNAHCQNQRAREIGSKLDKLGGMPLMLQAFQKVQKKAGKTAASHLEYAWVEIGRWMA
jgi:hypothetical protein